MADKTVKMLAPGLIGQTNLSLRLHRRGRAATLNGSGTSATIDSSGELTAVVTEAIGYPEEVLAVSIWNTSTGEIAWYPDSDSYVYMPADILGTYYVSAQAIDELERAMRDFPPQVRDIEDAQPIFFYWPYGSGKSLTGQKSLNGGALASLSGTITDSGVEQTASGKYRYRISYNAADRAIGSVAYKIVDSADASKVGVLSITFLPAASTGSATEAKQDYIISLLSSGQVDQSTPVSANGSIDEVVRGDDYLDDSGRAFSWDILPPGGFTIGEATCFFGGYKKDRGSWLVQGTITAVTIDSVDKWRLKFEPRKSDTQDCIPDENYFFSVEVRGPSERITKVWGYTRVVDSRTIN